MPSDQAELTPKNADISSAENNANDNLNNLNNIDNDQQTLETYNQNSESTPDNDCLFDPSLPKCSPDELGNCPEGFGMNEDEQCFPIHERCPEGYHSHEDDESGKCIPDSIPCDPGYIMNPEFPSCEIKEYVCQDYPNLDECRQNGSQNMNNPKLSTPTPYESGYTHGCSDSKISDPSQRYINQPEKGPAYHTAQFMSGYYNGFNICSEDNSKLNGKGTFKIIVEVSNYSDRDTTGSMSVSIDKTPENVFKSTNNLYFPSGLTVTKEFTFKSSDVPVGTGFEVNLDYGDDFNKYILGENTPAKKPEKVSFIIP